MTRPGTAGEVVLLRGGAEVARWPLPVSSHLGSSDLGLVDRLARLQLAARRAGLEVAVRGAPAELAGLIDLAGLSGVLDCGSGGGPARP